MGAYSLGKNVDIKPDLEKIYTMFPRLKERLKQRAGTFSGGEQQMLAIARALMNRPKVLLMDEPSMGIAPLVVEEIFRTIVKLNKEQGMTILLVEQNAQMALSIAHRAYVIAVSYTHLDVYKRQLLSWRLFITRSLLQEDQPVFPVFLHQDLFLALQSNLGKLSIT